MSRIPVALYIPNILCYIRIITAFWGLLYKDHHPVAALTIWLASAALDLFDGILARLLHQTSRLGILLDICADNVLRTCMWVAAASQYPDHPTLLVLTCIVISTEWFTFLTTQLHAQQPKQQPQEQQQQLQKEQDRQDPHWKLARTKDPWWIRIVFQGGFRNPLGGWIIYSLFATPLIVWLSDHPTIHIHIPFFHIWKYTAYAGRIGALMIEWYLSCSFLAQIIDDDDDSKTIAAAITIKTTDTNNLQSSTKQS